MSHNDNEYERDDLDVPVREAQGVNENCDTIEDPVRRGLCKMCGAPVVGEAPFCKNHEFPVP